MDDKDKTAGAEREASAAELKKQQREQEAERAAADVAQAPFQAENNEQAYSFMFGGMLRHRRDELRSRAETIGQIKTILDSPLLFALARADYLRHKKTTVSASENRGARTENKGLTTENR